MFAGVACLELDDIIALASHVPHGPLLAETIRKVVDWLLHWLTAARFSLAIATKEFLNPLTT